MSRSALHNIFPIALLIIFTGALGLTSGAGEPRLRCKEAERQTLLKIKEELHELEDGVLFSSWGEEEEKQECCVWIGIWCDNLSGHVIELDLSPATFGTQSYPIIRGNISSSLVGLQYLKYLDLSRIDFSGNSIPSFLGNLRKLNHLNLSDTSLSGEVPLQLGNLSDLQSLGLSGNVINIKNLNWVSHLSSLQLLDLSYIDMGMATDWVREVNNLPHLVNLILRHCSLPDVVYPSLSHVNSSKVLATVDLSKNVQVSESIFKWLFSNNRSLVHVALRRCNLKGSIPKAFGHMSSLVHLDLSYNFLEGSIPNAFRNITSLTYLDLHHNQLEGSILEYFGNMAFLAHLDLGDNQLDGHIPEYFGNMVALALVDLRDNSFNGSIPESFRNMSALTYLDLGYNQLEGFIPEFFGNMKALAHLDLGFNQFEGFFPEFFGNMTALVHLNLCYNQVEGFIPKSVGNVTAITFIDLGGNQLEGSIPEALAKMTLLEHLDLSHNYNLEVEILKSSWISMKYLDLSSNLIRGPLPNFTLMPSLQVLRLSSTQLRGNVSKSIGQLSNLSELDISANFIEGVMSEAHFAKLFELFSLNLSYNPGLHLNFSPDWNPPFQLARIMVGSCNLVHFPRWLETQNDIDIIEMPNSKISGCICWVWCPKSCDIVHIINK